MTEPQLELALRDLPSIGTLVKDRGYRQVWRFECNGRAFYLKFYPRGGFKDLFRRLTRGSPARLEFTRLQLLQRAKIPAPHAVALLMGMKIGRRSGDAVILDAIEPAIQLDALLGELELRAEEIPNHRELAAQIRDLVHQLALAKLGHDDLHLGNFILHEGKLFLLDGYAVHEDGLRLNDLLLLGHSVGRYATLTDLRRGWDELGPPSPMPTRNPVAAKLSNAWLWRITAENRYFGKISSGPWNGFFFKQDKHPRPWSDASRLQIDRENWTTALPQLLADMEQDRLPVIKRSKSGDVLSADVKLGGRTMPIIIKRPRRRYWYRYINEIGRGARARRAWKKAWNLIVRNVPTAWPLLLLEKRKFGYVTDCLIVFERVPGRTLSSENLDAIEPARRDQLFRRIGRLLRKIEQFGFSHFDAKASNWIVRPDEKRGPGPVLIDVDGIRRRRWIALGIDRLLRSLRQHRQYTVADSLALCQGYAPRARMAREEAAEPSLAGESRR